MVRRGWVGLLVGGLVGACSFPVALPDGGFICVPGCPFGQQCLNGVCTQVDEQPDGGEAADAGPDDAGTPDAGAADSGTPDAGPPDSGPADAGTFDAGPPTITSVVTEASTSNVIVAGSNTVRQGAGTVTIDILGQSLGGATSLTVGGDAASLSSVSETELQARPFIDHGVPAADLRIAVTLANGTTIAATGVFSVSYITAAPAGSDSAGDGSSLHPFRSLTQALSLASSTPTGAGDTVHLLDGTYDVADGEVWPTANALMGSGNPGIANKSSLPSNVTIMGDSQAQTILSGAGASALSIAEPVAVIPGGSGSLVQSLTIDGFGFGYVANSGSNALDNVLIQRSSQQGLLVWSNGATLSVSVTGNSGINGGQIDGIFVRHATLTMDGGSISGNSEYGVCLQDEAVASLSGVEITGNATGVYAGSSGIHSQTFTLDSCHIHDNQGPGVSAFSLAGSYHTAYINDSEIDSNQTGISLTTQTEFSLTTTAVVVDGGTIHGNTDDGILVSAAPWHVTALDLLGVTVQGNGGSGVELTVDQSATSIFDGGGSFTLSNVTLMGNSYGLRFEGSPTVAELGATASGGVNVLADNTLYQLSDERPQDAGLVIDASGAVLAVDGGAWPKGTLQTGPVSQPPAFQIVNRNNAIQF